MNSAQWTRSRSLYSVGNWGGFSMHLRGNTEGYLCAASKHKKLRVHTGTHFHPSTRKRADGSAPVVRHWLKASTRDHGRAAGQARDSAPVAARSLRLPLRERVAARAHAVDEDVPEDRPRAHRRADGTRVRSSRAAEDRHAGDLLRERRHQGGVASGSSLATTHGNTGRNGLSFETAPLEKDTEVTGPIVLNLWVSSTSEDWTSSCRCEHRSRRPGRVRGRPARPAGAPA